MTRILRYRSREYRDKPSKNLRGGCRIQERGSACADWSMVLSTSNPTVFGVQYPPDPTWGLNGIPVSAPMTAAERSQTIRGKNTTTVDAAGSNVMKMGAENNCPEASEQTPEQYTTAHKRISSSGLSEGSVICCQEPSAKATLSARTDITDW